MKNVFDKIPTDILKLRIKEKQPEFIQPMLATLTKDYFSSPDWIYEHKFDGVRCLAFKKKGKVTLLSRNKNNMNNTYPEIVTALEKQNSDNFVLDGEIIAEKNGVANFEMLQSRMNVKNVSKTKHKQLTITYCIFDVPYIDGYNIENLPLNYRKLILAKVLDYNKILVNTQYKVNDGIKMFHKACKMKWEGVIAKRFDSIYLHKRSTNWLKFKCVLEQELVIGGFTTPKGNRSYFGALLVGYYQNGEFKYAGKVGTGYSEFTLEFLGKKLEKLKTTKCPFTDYDGNFKNVHWVKPKLVAEFGFAEWTNAGKLRVGRYRGLRNDKDAKEVVKEIPK